MRCRGAPLPLRARLAPMTGRRRARRAEPASEEWTRLVATVATMPTLIAGLARAHVTDGHGRCRACTVPGLGTPGARWPCVLALLALDAARK